MAIYAVVALTVATAACSGPSHRSASPSTTVRPVPAGPDPDVIPPVITVPYVNAVFAVLNHVNGDAARELVARNSVTPNVLTYLRAIYSPPLYRAELSAFETGLVQDRSNLRPNFGDRRTRVNSLITALPTCIFVETTSDLSAVEVRPTAVPASEYWELQPKQPGQDPQGVNPTPWSLFYNQDYETPTSVASTCPAP